MAHVIEMARLLAGYCKGCGVELLAEGDVYPRPRYHVPSSILEMYDAVMRIDGGYDGILKYMVDYTSSPTYETGYLSRHTKSIPLKEELRRMFAGKHALGVNVSTPREQFAQADLSLGRVGYSPWPTAGAILATNSIPTVYGEGGICRMVIGEAARSLSPDCLTMGGILDALSAEILCEKGIDVGLDDPVSFSDGKIAYLKAPDGSETVLVCEGDARCASVSLKAGAEILLYAVVGDEKIPFAYRYENGEGAKFVVLCVDATALPRNSGVYRGYLQQELFASAVTWISGQELPVFLPACPDLYTICKGDDTGTAVAFFNFFADSVEDAVVRLDRPYRAVHFLNGEGRLAGDRLYISSIPAYSFVACSLSRD